MALLPHNVKTENPVLMVCPLSSDKDAEQYRSFLQQFPKHPFYNRELISFGNNENERLMYFILRVNDTPKVIMPFYLRKIFINEEETNYKDVSSPYGYSGPLFSVGTAKDLISSFWKEVDNWYRKNRVISEFIRFNLQENWKGYNGKIIPTLSNVCGRVLPEAEQWNNFKPKVRNNYRKSVSYQLRSSIYHHLITTDIIGQFYEIYTSTMERNQASEQYFFELEYFTNLITNNPTTCAIVIIYKDQIPISAELLLLSETTINSFLGGTVKEYFHMRPNDFLKTEVLKWAREKGYTHYSLGGGRTNNDSLYQYKKNFFPIEEDLIFYTGRKIIDEDGYNNLVLNNPACQAGEDGNYFPLYRYKKDL